MAHWRPVEGSALALMTLLVGCAPARDAEAPDPRVSESRKREMPETSPAQTREDGVLPVLTLIAQLGSASSEERDRAGSALQKMGAAALPYLRTARANTTDEEVRLRLESLLSKIDRLQFVVRTRIDATGDEGAWRPDGRQFALGSGKQVLIFDASSWTVQARIDPRQAVRNIWGIDYSPGGERLAIAYDLGIAIYTVSSGDCEAWLPSVRQSRGLRFLDEDRIASRDLLLHRSGGAWSAEEAPWKDEVNPGLGGLDVSRSLKRIAFSTSIGDRLHVKVFDFETFAPTMTLPLGKFNSYWSGQLYFSGNFLIAAGEADEVIVWRTDSWLEVGRGHPYHRSSLGAGRSSTFVFTASDGWLRGWSAPNWSEAASFATLMAQPRLFVSPVRDEIVVSPRPGTDGKFSTVVRLFRPE